MKKKTIAILVVCALIGSGGAFGGVQYYRNQKDKKTVVDVTPVVNMMGYDYGSEMMMDGTVIAGSKQNIRLEQNKVVQEVLVHVGLDTVNLKGEHYTAHVKDGDTVKKGDLILEFDMEKIKEAGYDLITPIVICNTDDYQDIETITGKAVNTEDAVMKLKA